MSNTAIAPKVKAASSESEDARRSRWAKVISEHWRRSLDGILAAGSDLVKAKAALPHGEFLAMIENDLPFGDRTARMLMAIANDERLRNRNHGSVLPPSWRTLYELTKLTDDKLQTAFATGQIHPETQRGDITAMLKKARRHERETELAARITALPDKRYGVIVADPEWRFEPWSRVTGMDRSADNHYPTSCLDVIKSRDVASISAKHCALFLWATGPMNPHALLVMTAWGFDYKAQYVWGKDKFGTGYWNREKHELLLIGTRGDVPCPAPGAQWDSLIMAPRGGHSEKPECFLEMIEQYFPNIPKIELNRRGPPRPGWDAWGNEAVLSLLKAVP